MASSINSPLPRSASLRPATMAMIALAALLASPPGSALGDGSKDEKHQAFFHGSIGTELMPLPVAQVLPDLYPRNFQPLGKDAGDWIEQFGFIRSKDKDSQGLPVGFTVSNLTPGTGKPSPVPFVGLGCATCHTALIRRSIDDEGTLVVGTGNPSLNLFAWLDAYQASTLQKLPNLLDPTDKARAIPVGVKEADLLTASKVGDAYKAKFGKALTDVEMQVVAGWLDGIATFQAATLPRFDQPFGSGRSIEPRFVPTGPGRTQPFRTLVRTVVNRPGATMNVFTKIAPVYQEDLLEWAQVDGGIRDIRIRSALAAMAAGASVEILANETVGKNIELATDFTRKLAGPKYHEVFPDLARLADPDTVHRGRASYAKHCASCHGRPEARAKGGWIKAEHGSRLGVIIPVEEIGTDPERVEFRYFEELPDLIFARFPKDHPFHFEREDLRPGPLGTRRGYITKPLDSAFSRAPYLHNASVPTLAELINLRPRRSTYYVGKAIYDPENVGLVVSEERDAVRYFRYDASLPGNSNRGHDYPWAYKGPGWDERELRDLLEYLKTL